MNIFKSKTINFNALAAAIVTILEYCGVKVPTEVITAGFTIGNIILRTVTTKPLQEK